MHRRKFFAQVAGGAAALAAAAGLVSTGRPGTGPPLPAGKGPLRVHPRNPRYFIDASGRTLYLAGAHTWANFQDSGAAPVPRFDWREYLEMLCAHNHNFIRLWSWEHATWASWTADKVSF